MTDEEIMDMCREECESFRWPSSAIYIARAIEAKVREECAVICEETVKDEDVEHWELAAYRCAEAIRSGGEDD